MGLHEGSAVAGAFWSDSPVAAITSTNNNKINGQIAVTVVTSSIVSSIPRLIVGIWKGNYTHEFISSSRVLAVHLLQKDQFEFVRNFGFYTGREKNKFEKVNHSFGVTGSPIIDNTHSYLEGEVINAMDGGDMTAFLVKVIEGKINKRGHWMTLSDFYNFAPPEWIAEYDQKLSKSIQFSLPIINKIDYTPFNT